MCNEHCIRFVELTVNADEIFGKYILESGSRNVNGSVRPYIEKYLPASYIGTDIVEGPGVDQLCDANYIYDVFGVSVFDMIISTEMIEHVEDWRSVISNFKRALKPGGILYITTRSKGFGYHSYPHDYWRYEIEDMKQIFEDFEILLLQADPSEPGVFLKARKPKDFVEKDLSAYKLYPIKRETHEMIGNAPKSFITGVPGWESEEEQKLLVELATNTKPGGLILEIGGEFGMSASLFCAAALKDVKIITVDLFPGNLLAVHQSNLAEAGFEARSEQIVADSKELAKRPDEFAWKKQGIDLLFIDSDHSYAGVKQDIEDWSKYVNPGGLMIFHDTVTSSNPIGKAHPSHIDVSKAVDEFLANVKSSPETDLWDVLMTAGSITVLRKSTSAPVLTVEPETIAFSSQGGKTWPVDEPVKLDGENEKDLHDSASVASTDGSVKRHKSNRPKTAKISS